MYIYKQKTHKKMIYVIKYWKKIFLAFLIIDFSTFFVVVVVVVVVTVAVLLLMLKIKSLMSLTHSLSWIFLIKFLVFSFFLLSCVRHFFFLEKPLRSFFFISFSYSVYNENTKKKQNKKTRLTRLRLWLRNLCQNCFRFDVVYLFLLEEKKFSKSEKSNFGFRIKKKIKMSRRIIELLICISKYVNKKMPTRMPRIHIARIEIILLSWVDTWMILLMLYSI